MDSHSHSSGTNYCIKLLKQSCKPVQDLLSCLIAFLLWFNMRALLEKPWFKPFELRKCATIKKRHYTSFLALFWTLSHWWIFGFVFCFHLSLSLFALLYFFLSGCCPNYVMVTNFSGLSFHITVLFFFRRNIGIHTTSKANTKKYKNGFLLLVNIMKVCLLSLFFFPSIFFTNILF